MIYTNEHIGENETIQQLYDNGTWLKAYAPTDKNKIEAYIKYANFIVGITKRVNWFHKLMLKIFFGLEVENVKKEFKENKELELGE